MDEKPEYKELLVGVGASIYMGGSYWAHWWGRNCVYSFPELSVVFLKLSTQGATVGPFDCLDRGDKELIYNFNGERSTWIIEEEVLRMECGLNWR